MAQNLKIVISETGATSVEVEHLPKDPETMNTCFSLVQTGENSLDAQFGHIQAENIELQK